MCVYIYMFSIFSMGGMVYNKTVFKTPYVVLIKTRFGLQATRGMFFVFKGNVF